MRRTTKTPKKVVIAPLRAVATKTVKARKPKRAQTVASVTDSTRDRVMDVAERLFAECGIEDVTLRQVTSAADANLAAVHYHFGSRDDLLRAILERRMTPLLEERQRRLSAALRQRSQTRRLELVVRAFVEPTMEYDCSADNYLIHRLVSRLAIYEAKHPTDLFQFVLAESHQKFLNALAEQLPRLDKERLGLRFEFMLALIAHVAALRARLSGTERSVHGITSAEGLVSEMIATLITAFRAP